MPLPLHKAPLQHVLSDTVMSNLCPSVITAALMLFRTSSRLGKKKKTKITAKIFNTINCCNKCKIVYLSKKKKKNSHTFRFYSQMVQKHLPDQKSVLWNSPNCIKHTCNRIKQRIKNTTTKLIKSILLGKLY